MFCFQFRNLQGRKLPSRPFRDLLFKIIQNSTPQFWNCSLYIFNRNCFYFPHRFTRRQNMIGSRISNQHCIRSNNLKAGITPCKIPHSNAWHMPNMGQVYHIYKTVRIAYKKSQKIWQDRIQTKREGSRFTSFLCFIVLKSPRHWSKFLEAWFGSLMWVKDYLEIFSKYSLLQWSLEGLRHFSLGTSSQTCQCYWSGSSAGQLNSLLFKTFHRLPQILTF